MNKDKIEKMSLEELHTYYGILSEICADYAKITDGYALATGDSMFETIPHEMKQAIKERQEFFSYRETIREIIIKRIRDVLND